MLTTSLKTASRRPAFTASFRARLNSPRRFTSTMHENDPEVLEREKSRVLRRSPDDKTSAPHEHAPGWNETLASTSEAFVKADKSEGDPQTLQSSTVDFMRARRVETDGETSTTAYYSRDEVSGPLRNAESTKEKVIVRHGKVELDIEGPNVVEKSLKDHDIRTPSEEDVKADRGEI